MLLKIFPNAKKGLLFPNRSWADKSFFYHIYPLGFCGAETYNDFQMPVVSRLTKVLEWLPHIRNLGADALYIGPLFETSVHGYDTADYFHVDRRLGCNDDLRSLAQALHARGMKLVLDAVFNHVGRRFFAFQDVLRHKEQSAYCSWFCLDFSKDNHYGDGFCYEGWAGCDDIVKLNLAHPPVRDYLLKVVSFWVREFDVDGLRLDAANRLCRRFVRELSAHCRGLKNDFWLMGEYVYGDYARLACPQMCHSVTNYEGYQALHSSFNQGNLRELAHTLERQFHRGTGVYRHCLLYNFLDNHDVSRIASIIKDKRKLFPLYTLLFTISGIPSIYYGSEWEEKGERSQGDACVRPCLERQKDKDLTSHIRKLACLRRQNPVLVYGDFRLIDVESDILVFSRRWQRQEARIAVNISAKTKRLKRGMQCKYLPPYGSSCEIFSL